MPQEERKEDRRFQNDIAFRAYIDEFVYEPVRPEGRGETMFVDFEGNILTQAQIEVTQRYVGFTEAYLGLPQKHTEEPYREGYDRGLRRVSSRFLPSPQT